MPWITPVSCTGKNPFGTNDIKHNGQDERAGATSRVIALVVEDPLERPAVKIDHALENPLGTWKSRPCACSAFSRRNREHIIGVSVSETTAETRMVTPE